MHVLASLKTLVNTLVNFYEQKKYVDNVNKDEDYFLLYIISIFYIISIILYYFYFLVNIHFAIFCNYLV